VKYLSLWDKFLERITLILVVILVFFLVATSFSSIVTRYTGGGFDWAPSLARHLVFLLAFLGASLATADNKHIRIDIVGNFIKISDHYKKIIDILLALVVLGVILILLKSSIDFYISEKAYPKDEFLGLKNYHLLLPIPFGFLIMFLRSLNQIFFIARGEK
jgi:TRAP-type C4-dicarboxylate transport system permease small subunit